MPIMMVYNFGSSILRAVGDTKRPLIYLAIGGCLNVLLNLFFVIVLKKDVEGVAIYVEGWVYVFDDDGVRREWVGES